MIKRRGRGPTGQKADFENWLKRTFPEWTWSWRYQRYLYELLSRVTKGECRRLMIFMPPRHGKSETVTVRYTAWRLLREPKLNVIIGSYNQRLADRFSRKIRRVFTTETLRRAAQQQQPEMDTDARGIETAPANSVGVHPSSVAKIPGFRLASALSEWETPAGGVVRSVGVGAGIAGFGAGLIVIDDPVRNRADAESEAFRDKVFDWFNDDIYTRLEPDASIILIQTRWHEDDLAGRLIREQEDGGEQWEIVRLPALAESKSDAFRHLPDNPESNKRESETPKGVTLTGDPLGRKPGEALCPKRYNAAALERIRKKIGSYSFSAMYQQDPVPASAGRFRREWFRNIVDFAPPDLRWKRGYDLAISTRTSADYTASFRCAYDASGNLYIADGFRRRIEYPDQRRYIVERMRNEPGTEHGIEAAMHGRSLVQDLRREAGVRRYAFRAHEVEADKLTRALAWLNLAEAGKVFLVRGPWIDEFIDEVCRFPSGRYDDQVDAVSIAVAMLSRRPGRLFAF